MKTKQVVALLPLLVTLSHPLSCLRAQGTAFTYQGRLNANGAPANGSYDLTFTLLSAVTGGIPVAGPITNSAVAVSNGLFTATIDFGASVWHGATNWLEIGVATNGTGGFTTMAPRRQLTPSPYAIFAQNLGSGGLAAGTYGSAVIFNNPSNQFSGTFTGDGTSLTNVNAANLAGLSAGAFWQTSGNAGTTPGVNFLGTTDNQPLELKAAAQRALRLEPNTAAGAPNVIGGSPFNGVDIGIVGATIAGGGSPGLSNRVGAIYGFIGGGRNNNVFADHSSIGGGHDNYIGPFAYDSVIAGGASDTIQGSALESAIGGGDYNTIQAGASWAFIGGGYGNTISPNATYAGIDGGFFNQNQGSGSFIGGGYANQVQPGASYATIAGGTQNVIGTNSQQAAIGGGSYNVIQNGSTNSVIAGGSGNTIWAGANWAFIGGGLGNIIYTNGTYATIAGGWGNSNQGDAASIGGGLFNLIQNGSYEDVIGGGANNSVGLNAFAATIGGGVLNQIQAGLNYATISGGTGNVVGTGTQAATIGGGQSNTNLASCSVIGGGQQNSIQSNAPTAAIGGGYFNVIQTNASDATIAGGVNNTIQANANSSTIGGGFQNTVLANAAYATIPGGYLDSASGLYSFAAGRQAHALHNGAFVWADSQALDFASTAADQLSIRAQGGVRLSTGTSVFFDNQLRQMLNLWSTQYGIGIQNNTLYCRTTGRFSWYSGGSHADGDNDPGPGGTELMTLTSGGLAVNGTFVSASDRNCKEHFQSVSASGILDQVLALPITRWNYKNDPATPHLGPMAQDFYAAFTVGPDDKHIATVDESGVALAAIQGLNQRLEARTRQLEAENADLKARLEKLEQFISSQRPR